MKFIRACQWAMAPLQEMVQPMAQRPKPLFNLQTKNLYTEPEELQFHSTAKSIETPN